MESTEKVQVPGTLRSPQTTVAIVLTFVGGYVDAIGFLTLGGIYIANMSGNSISVGMHTARGVWPVTLFRLWSIVSYLIGLIAGRMLVHFIAAMGIRRVAAAAFLSEAVLLLLFLKSSDINAGIFFAATAMGIQAATVSRFNGVTVYTVFVTGSLVKFAESLSEMLVRSIRGQDREQTLTDALWFLGVWLAYVIGATAGAAALAAVGRSGILFAHLALLALTMFDYARPIEFAP